MRFKPFLAYSASAGSGKTFALSVRYISLLFMGEVPSSILAATFTNKAAAEMRQRVVEALRSLGDNEAFLDAVCSQTGLSREELFAKQPEVLAQFLSGSSYIVTLDSFFSSILRSASLEIGLEPDFVTKEQGTQELEDYFLDEVQAGGLLSSLVKLAMDIEDKRFTKIFDLMQNLYKADPLLPEKQQSEHTVSVIEEEIHACREVLYSLVVESGASKRAVDNFIPMSIKELSARNVFAKESLCQSNDYKKYVQKYPQIDDHFVALKSKLARWIQIRERIVLENLFKIYEAYRNATIASVKASGVLSFDDLTYFTYRLLHESLSKEFLYFKIDSKFKHILLDEFQDTSTLQFLLLKPLIDEIFSGKGQSEFKSFFYVGDTKQSLYRFRGGVEELFDKVAEHYGVTIEQMDTNYRSAKQIVEQVNRSFEGVMPQYVPQKSKKEAELGYVEVLESEEPILEAIRQAKRLLALGICLDDITFLVNTNKDGVALQEACHAEGIDTLLHASSSLKYIPKIAALVAMVSYLVYGEKIDAHALLQKVGKSLDKIDVSWFSMFMSPLQVLDRLVREFGYFDADMNILKLLEFSAGFTDLPTFIEEFQTSSIGVAANSVHGAKILTIHGSKGLEFEYVIVLDKLTRPNHDKTALLYRYDESLHIDKIFYRTKNRESFDSDYLELLEARKTAAAKDRKNILYVALTRAVLGLIVIKKPKESIFDEINLTPVSLGVLQPKERQKKEQERRVEILPEYISHYGVQETPSAKEEEEKEYEALLFGTALHYGLEMLNRFDEESIEDAITAVKNRYGGALLPQSIEQIRVRIERLIKHEGFQSLLAGAQIRKEQAISFEGELKQIDLLLAYETGYVIVDYKSSKKFAHKHQEQVRLYQRAIESITGKQSQGVIVYLEEETIELLNLTVS